MMRPQKLVQLTALMALLGVATVGQAATVAAPGAPISSGSLVLSGEATTAGTSGTGTNTALAVPGSYFFGNSFASVNGVVTGSADLGGSGAGYGFYDAFAFTITGATADSLTTTLDLGNLLQISGIQARLYSVAVGGSTPVLGAPSGIGGTLIDAWASPIGTSGTALILQDAVLAPGTYVLEIRGTVTGTAGGSYSGTLNLAPSSVPLPFALPLLLSGLGLVGAARVRRRG